MLHRTFHRLARSAPVPACGDGRRGRGGLIAVPRAHDAERCTPGRERNGLVDLGIRPRDPSAALVEDATDIVDRAPGLRMRQGGGNDVADDKRKVLKGNKSAVDILAARSAFAPASRAAFGMWSFLPPSQKPTSGKYWMSTPPPDVLAGQGVTLENVTTRALGNVADCRAAADPADFPEPVLTATLDVLQRSIDVGEGPKQIN